jgi:predicted secreted protein
MSGMEEVKATAHVHASPAPRASLQKCVNRGSRACSDEQAHCRSARVKAHCRQQKARGKSSKVQDAQNDATR